MSIPEISVPSSGRNKPPPRPLRRILAESQTHCMFLELSAANSIPAFMFHRYSSSLFGIVPPSTLIITGTRFTLFIFHNSHSRSKKYVQCPYVGYWIWFFIHSDFLNMRSWKNFILQLSSALASNTLNQKLKSRRPFRSFAGFHCQAIENKNQNRLIDKLQKLGNQKGSKYTFSIGRCIFPPSSFIPYDPKLSTYMDE